MAIYDGIIGALSIVLMYIIGYLIYYLQKCAKNIEDKIIDSVAPRKWKIVVKRVVVALFIVWILANVFLLISGSIANQFGTYKDTGGIQYHDSLEVFFPIGVIFSSYATGDILHVYDYTEFLIYSIIYPFLLGVLFCYKKKLCKSQVQEKILGFTIKTIALWSLILFIISIANSYILLISWFYLGLPISIYIVAKLEKILWPLYEAEQPL